MPVHTGWACVNRSCPSCSVSTEGGSGWGASRTTHPRMKVYVHPCKRKQWNISDPQTPFALNYFCFKWICTNIDTLCSFGDCNANHTYIKIHPGPWNGWTLQRQAGSDVMGEATWVGLRYSFGGSTPIPRAPGVAGGQPPPMASWVNCWEARCHLALTDGPRMSFLFLWVPVVRVLLLSAEGDVRYRHILGQPCVVIGSPQEGLEWL